MVFWRSEGFIVSQPTTLLMYFFPYGKKGCAIDSVGFHPRFLRRMTPFSVEEEKGNGFLAK